MPLKSMEMMTLLTIDINDNVRYADVISQTSRTYEYDIKGNLIKETGFPFDYIRKYDAKNNLVEELDYSNTKGFLSHKMTIRYVKGLKIETLDTSVFKDKRCLSETNIFKYDDNKNLSDRVQSFYDCSTNNKVPTQKNNFVYSYTNGKLKEESIIINGILTPTKKKTYDIQNRKIKEESISHYNNYRSITEYTYDTNNHIIEILTSNNGKIESHEFNKYDKKNNLTEKNALDGKKKKVFAYSYNAKNQVVRESYAINGGIVYIKEYVYDAKGNVIKATYTNNNKEIFFGYSNQIYYYN
ncbi:hypothetical protein [Pedobacter borealis]|uniref:hypothetical protein n=1 Tax=Pedobacter borealis TaxID=475254 RepID=UPI0012F93F3B|nr:hypothetical protein [Pedobacter borealis]